MYITSTQSWNAINLTIKNASGVNDINNNLNCYTEKHLKISEITSEINFVGILNMMSKMF